MSTLTETQQTWKVHLEAAAAEGVPLSSYASRHGLSVSALYTAKQRIRERESGASSSFLRVRETRIERTREVQAPLMIRLPNGVSLSVPYDRNHVESVLKVLAAL